MTAMVCEIIGYERLEQLCTELGGARWYIPVHPPKERRDERIRQEFDRLMMSKELDTTTGAYNALAIKYGLSADHIRKIVANQ